MGNQTGRADTINKNSTTGVDRSFNVVLEITYIANIIDEVTNMIIKLGLGKIHGDAAYSPRIRKKNTALEIFKSVRLKYGILQYLAVLLSVYKNSG